MSSAATIDLGRPYLTLLFQAFIIIIENLVMFAAAVIANPFMVVVVIVRQKLQVNRNFD